MGKREEFEELKRLEELGLVKRNNNGYIAVPGLKIEGYIFIGRKLIPRLILYSFILVFGTVLMSILASAYLNHKQIKHQNQARIDSAIMRFERLIHQNIKELDNNFKAFSDKSHTARILLNCIQQNYFYFPSLPDLFDIGSALELDRFAFYFPTKFTGTDILQIYFSYFFISF